VRIEADPGNRIEGAVRVATAGSHVALAFKEGDELSLRLLELTPTPATHPPPREWTYTLSGEPPEPDE
ncbi:hypothetical protein HY251_08775, partial [bacterium]|nr:hypothetical protein [bacterium]